MIFERLAPVQHDTIDGVPEPSENPHLLGHDQAAAQLASAFRAGRLHHGLLLTGPAGIGKTTLAFRLAFHLLSFPRPGEAPDHLVAADPASPLFRSIAQGAHPNVLHLTRPANERTKGFKTVITVDEIRRLARFLSMTAHDGGWRIVIVDPADDLNVSAANALLKSLEEPPPRTVFILIAHSPGALLPTIRSRCQTVRLQPLSGEQVVQVLGALGLGVPQSQEAQAALVERAGGSVRAAILLTEYGGLEIAQAVDAVLGDARFGVAAAAKIADAVTGREQATQFDLFNAHLLDTVSRRAADAAVAGDGSAEGLATLWTQMSGAIAETDTYNLDKRQHVIGSLMRVHRALHGA